MVITSIYDKDTSFDTFTFIDTSINDSFVKFKIEKQTRKILFIVKHINNKFTFVEEFENWLDTKPSYIKHNLLYPFSHYMKYDENLKEEEVSNEFEENRMYVILSGFVLHSLETIDDISFVCENKDEFLFIKKNL